MNVKRALISVFDKSGLTELCRCLTKWNYDIVSTGGTAGFLSEQGFRVTQVESITGFPEMFQGRVKTLHPRIHGGILAKRTDETHSAEMLRHGIEAFDMVVVNLYPFGKVAAETPEDIPRAIENIDIGGPALIRSAAKNHDEVTVVCSPRFYPELIRNLNENEGTVSLEFRRRLAVEAFRLTGEYDLAIHNYFSSRFTVKQEESDRLRSTYCIYLSNKRKLRYGENPHQEAARYDIRISGSDRVSDFYQLSGKELSFNNIMDMNAAWMLVNMFHEPAAVVVKHQNPCGVAVRSVLSDAYLHALEADPVSAYGGIVAVNREIDDETARRMHNTRFLEVIAAPSITESARRILKKKKNRRILLIASNNDAFHLDVKLFFSGALVQTQDIRQDIFSAFVVVTERQPNPQEVRDLEFAWRVCRHVKSNAIVLAEDTATVGIGAGQVSRIDAVKIAVKKAQDIKKGPVVLASDAFFPFRDGVDYAAGHGVTAIIQPGGSKRDAEVIRACNEANIAMVFTGIRHFKH